MFLLHKDRQKNNNQQIKVSIICFLIENYVSLHKVRAHMTRMDDKLPMMTHLPRKEYIDTWGMFESPLFEYKLNIFGKKRTEFCYAGDWSFFLNLVTGEMSQGYQSYFTANIFEDISLGTCRPKHQHSQKCKTGNALMA